MQAKDLIRLPIHSKSALRRTVEFIARQMRRPHVHQSSDEKHADVIIRQIPSPNFPVIGTSATRAQVVEIVAQKCVVITGREQVVGEISPGPTIRTASVQG